MRYFVKLRRGKHWAVKPEAEKIDGHVYSFNKNLGWVIERGIYLGETAMIPKDKNYPDDAPPWIASGDLRKIGSNGDEVPKIAKLDKESGGGE